MKFNRDEQNVVKQALTSCELLEPASMSFILHCCSHKPSSGKWRVHSAPARNLPWSLLLDMSFYEIHTERRCAYLNPALNHSELIYPITGLSLFAVKTSATTPVCSWTDFSEEISLGRCRILWRLQESDLLWQGYGPCVIYKYTFHSVAMFINCINISKNISIYLLKFQKFKKFANILNLFVKVREDGNAPSSQGWKSCVLLLNYTRLFLSFFLVLCFSKTLVLHLLKWKQEH